MAEEHCTGPCEETRTRHEGDSERLRQWMSESVVGGP